MQRCGRSRSPDDPGRQDDRREQDQEQETPGGVSQAPADGQHVDAVHDEQEEPREAREAGRHDGQERHEEVPARGPFDLVQERGDGEEAQVEEQHVVPGFLAVPQEVGRAGQEGEGDDPHLPSGQSRRHPVEEQEPDRAEQRREGPDLGLALPEDVHPASQEHEVERAVRIEDDVLEAGADLSPGGEDGVDLVMPEALLPQGEEADRDPGREDAEEGQARSSRRPRPWGFAFRGMGRGDHLRTSPTTRITLTTTLG